MAVDSQPGGAMGAIGAIGLAQNLGSTTIPRQNPSLDVLPMKNLGCTTRLAPGADVVALSRI